MSEVEAHVQQALNEMDNGLAHGTDDAVESGRKRLAAAGVSERDARAQAAGKRRAAAQSDDEAAEVTTAGRDKAPVGRQSPAAKRATT